MLAHVEGRAQAATSIQPESSLGLTLAKSSRTNQLHAP
jgi:hypothetical protein